LWLFGSEKYVFRQRRLGDGDSVNAFHRVQRQPDLAMGHGHKNALAVALQNLHVIKDPAVFQLHFGCEQRADGQKSAQNNEPVALHVRVPLLFDAYCVRVGGEESTAFCRPDTRRLRNSPTVWPRLIVRRLFCREFVGRLRVIALRRDHAALAGKIEQPARVNHRPRIPK
jgi:hypothetical protein